jgi:hypothetical protein
MRLFALFALLLAAASPAHAQTAPVYDALDAYAHYQNDVSILLDARIDSAEALDAALARIARHDPNAVSRGWIAYTSITAAQSPAFVAGVRSRVAAASRAAVIRQFVRDITYARRRPPGGDQATQLILAAIETDTARLQLAGDRFEAIGRDADMSGWTTVEDRNARHVRLVGTHVTDALPAPMLARLHIGAGVASPLTDPTAFGGRTFWDALAGRTAQLPAPRAARERWLGGADRMRTLAGLIIVDALQSQSARVEELLTDREASYCLSIQQLQLRQCAASANAPNEDALCLARHGFAGPAACFAALTASEP